MRPSVFPYSSLCESCAACALCMSVVFFNKQSAVGVCVLLLQDLLQSCARGGRRRVEDMCYERRRAEACVDESAHHALVNDVPELEMMMMIDGF